MSISSQQLRRQFILNIKGRPYSARGLKMDLLQVEKAYHDEGFLHVSIDPPDVKTHKFGDEEAADILVRIREGARFVSGKVSVNGVDVLGSDAVVQMYPLQKGQPYRHGRIIQWQESIEDAYRSLGYMRARCAVNESLNETQQSVDCSMDCSEGKLYRVGKIDIAGDESIDRIRFKRRLLVSEGGIFNPENLFLSIQYLNRSGLYKRISDSDVEIQIDDVRAAVDLTFHIFAPPGSGTSD